MISRATSLLKLSRKYVAVMWSYVHYREHNEVIKNEHWKARCNATTFTIVAVQCVYSSIQVSFANVMNAFIMQYVIPGGTMRVPSPSDRMKRVRASIYHEFTLCV